MSKSKKVTILGLLISLLTIQVDSAQTTSSNIPKNWTQITFNTAEDFHAHFSPDGTKIVFDSNRAGKYALFVYDLKTKETKQLTSGKIPCDHPNWFPDSKKVLCECGSDGRKDLFSIQIADTAMTRLTNTTTFNGGGQVSPRGDRISFFSNRNGNWDVFLMNADGGNIVQATSNKGDDVDVDWSSDGSKLLFTTIENQHFQICIMNADGSQYRQITTGNYSNKNPRFNADGDKIAFISDRSGSDQIYLMNLDGTGEEQLTDSKTIKYDLFWKHNSKDLLYNVGEEQVAEIYMLSITDKKEMPLTQNHSREAIPTFSPDGKRVLFVSELTGNFRGVCYKSLIIINLFEIFFNNLQTIQILPEQFCPSLLFMLKKCIGNGRMPFAF